jgi:hypothetical protein
VWEILTHGIPMTNPRYWDASRLEKLKKVKKEVSEYTTHDPGWQTYRPKPMDSHD